jgi:hypothetical protein
MTFAEKLHMVTGPWHISQDVQSSARQKFAENHGDKKAKTSDFASEVLGDMPGAYYSMHMFDNVHKVDNRVYL